MERSQIVFAAVLVWGALFVYSFFSTSGVEPTGDGFTRGLNRVTLFLQWHSAALVTAIGVLIAGWRLANQRRRWLSRLPAMVHIVAIAGLVVTVLVVYQREKANAVAGQQPPPQTVPAP